MVAAVRRTPAGGPRRAAARAIALGATSLGGLALAAASRGAPAGTATAPAAIHIDRACYVRTGAAPPRMTLTGARFTPGDRVSIADSTGTLHATTTADAAGRISARVAGPSILLTRPEQMRDTITATDRTAAGTDIVATAATHVSILGAGHGSTSSQRGLRALSERTGWVFSGWPVGRTIYVHYLRRGRQVARQSFGRAPAPCGVLHARGPLYPGTPRASSYRTQIDTAARYSARTRPRFTRLRVGLELEF